MFGMPRFGLGFPLRLVVKVLSTAHNRPHAARLKKRSMLAYNDLRNSWMSTLLHEVSEPTVVSISHVLRLRNWLADPQLDHEPTSALS